MNLASIVLCAGKSTRFKSATSKILHPICGKPMFAWPLDEVVPMGGKIIAVIGHQAEEVKQAITARYGDKVNLAVQTEQRGTGHAAQIAMQALGNFKGTVLVLCGDTPLLKADTLRQLIAIKHPAAMITTTLSDPTGYGRIIRNSTHVVDQIVEEAEASDEQKAIREINTGIYAFDADFLRDALAKLKPSAHKGELYLTDVVRSARASSFSISADEAMGINDRVQLATAESIMRRRINERWMREGVTMIDDKSTYIDADVTLSSDVVLEPGVCLRGKTTVGEGTRIRAYSVCDDAVIGPNCEVGPFARLRPETRLDEKVKIGNFVEVKKSHFRTGAKANHLAYIGDTTVGEKSNIGAGTITCNYDGFKKHQTIIDDGVFIGSNSTLVAPLHIEAHAYIAAGSTINRDVPTDALAISRGRQENKEGYAKKIRDRIVKHAPSG